MGQTSLGRYPGQGLSRTATERVKAALAWVEKVTVLRTPYMQGQEPTSMGCESGTFLTWAQGGECGPGGIDSMAQGQVQA